MKKMKESKEMKKVAQVVLAALFALCVDISFAFGTYNHTYNHNVRIQNDSVADWSRAGTEAYRSQIEMEKLKEEKIKSDPEYALRYKLNKKENALGRVIGESDKKIGTLNEKEKILNEKFGLLFDELKPLQDKAKSIFARLDILTEKEKELDTSKLLPQEKDEVKNFLSKAVELNTKRQAMSNKLKVYSDKASALNENFTKKATDFVNMLQKYSTEMEKYQYKIEYDNKAYETFLNIQEKRAEVLINWAREYEIFVSKTEKLLEEFDELSTEHTNFCKDIIKHKSFIRKYERFFKKVEKRLGV